MAGMAKATASAAAVVKRVLRMIGLLMRARLCKRPAHWLVVAVTMARSTGFPRVPENRAPACLPPTSRAHFATRQNRKNLSSHIRVRHRQLAISSLRKPEEESVRKHFFLKKEAKTFIISLPQGHQQPPPHTPPPADQSPTAHSS
jgi:hypothetical protein